MVCLLRMYVRIYLKSLFNSCKINLYIRYWNWRCDRVWRILIKSGFITKMRLFRGYRIGIHTPPSIFICACSLLLILLFFNYLPANYLNYLPFLFPWFYKKSAYLSNIECNMSRMVTRTLKMVSYTSRMVTYTSKMVSYMPNIAY